MPRPPSRGGSAILTPTGTPNAAPIRSTDDARKYLDKNGWVLLGEPYSRSKLAHIIATVALGDTLTSRTTGDVLKPDIRNTLLSVAFLINSDITDHISDALTEAITSKTEASLSKLENAALRLADSVNFSAANDISRATASITLDKIAQKLNTVTNALTALSSLPPQTTTPPPPPSRGTTSWADAVRINLPTPSSRYFNPASDVSHTRLQQRVIRDSRIIRINFLKSDDTVPTDHSPNGLATLRESINQKLATIDSRNDIEFPDHSESPPPKTFVRGITATDKGAFIVELDTAESVQRFTKYTNDTSLSFPSSILGASATIGNRPHCVIAKFVPCDGAFDPDDNDHLRQIEYDNFLPEHSITTARWLKRAAHRSPSQTTATIKLICTSATTANRMINKRIFISGKK
ncbi:hypothetical protein C0991_002680, partial [Blastosporella zonata]